MITTIEINEIYANYFSKIMDVIKKDYDNYNDIKDKLEIILKTIESDISNITIVDDYEVGKEFIINLNNHNFYGFDFDGKNYPLLSFSCNTIFINKEIIQFDDNIIINYDFDFSNFKRLD